MTFISIFIALLALFLIFFIIRNAITFKNQMLISNAIFCHNICSIRNGKVDDVIEFSEMEEYEKTLFRFWDFGYKRILPKEKFKLIEPYIGLNPDHVSELICHDIESNIKELNRKIDTQKKRSI